MVCQGPDGTHKPMVAGSNPPPPWKGRDPAYRPVYIALTALSKACERHASVGAIGLTIRWSVIGLLMWCSAGRSGPLKQVRVLCVDQPVERLQVGSLSGLHWTTHPMSPRDPQFADPAHLCSRPGGSISLSKAKRETGVEPPRGDLSLLGGDVLLLRST
jgi:hypothetical protein